MSKRTLRLASVGLSALSLSVLTPLAAQAAPMDSHPGNVAAPHAPQAPQHPEHPAHPTHPGHSPVLDGPVSSDPGPVADQPVFDGPISEDPKPPVIQDPVSTDECEVTASANPEAALRKLKHAESTTRAIICGPVSNEGDDDPRVPEQQVADAYATQGFYVAQNQAFDFDVTELTGYTGGKATLVTNAAHGAVVIDADGSGTYTPETGYTGDDEFTYTVLSADGSVLLHGTTQIYVFEVAIDPTPAPEPTPVPETPAPTPSIPDLIYTVGDFATVTAGETTTVDVLANDTSLNGRALTLTGVKSSNGHASVVNNKLVYESADDAYVGSKVESVQYTVSDGVAVATGTAKVTVLPRLVVLADTASVKAGQSITVDVLGNDVAEGASITGMAAPQSGSVKIVDNKIVYTAEATFSGVDEFSYAVTDKYGRTGMASVKVTVEKVAPAPAPTDTPTTAPAPVQTPTPSAPTTAPVSTTPSAPAPTTTTTPVATTVTTTTTPVATTTTAAPRSLAYTGFDPKLGLLFGAGLIVLGGGAVIAGRSRSTRQH